MTELAHYIPCHTVHIKVGPNIACVNMIPVKKTYKSA